MPSKRNVGICLLDRNGATMNPEASSGISFREVYKRVSLLLIPKMICLFGILQRALYVSQLKTRGICSNFRKISHKKRPCRFFLLFLSYGLLSTSFCAFLFYSPIWYSSVRCGVMGNRRPVARLCLIIINLCGNCK